MICNSFLHSPRGDGRGRSGEIKDKKELPPLPERLKKGRERNNYSRGATLLVFRSRMRCHRRRDHPVLRRCRRAGKTTFSGCFLRGNHPPEPTCVVRMQQRLRPVCFLRPAAHECVLRLHIHSELSLCFGSLSAACLVLLSLNAGKCVSTYLTDKDIS